MMGKNKVKYLIVGSGVAGSTIAEILLDKNKDESILILDAGPKFLLKDRQHWWNYVSTGKRPYENCEDQPQDNLSLGLTPWIFKESRLMIYGGSTVHWGGWSLRFQEEDFNLYSNIGRGADWPIKYSDLEKYYCEAEMLLGVSGEDNYGPQRTKPYPLKPFEYASSDSLMIQAFQKLGISYSKMPIARFRKCMQTGTCKYCPIGARYTSAYQLDKLSDKQKHPNFSIRTNTVAIKINLQTKYQIENVEILNKRDNRQELIYPEKIIICAGAYESPKLLQSSKSDYWLRGIGNDYNNVGRHLIAHPFLYVRGKFNKNEGFLQQEYDFPTLMSRYYDTKEHQSKGKLFLFKSRSRPRFDLHTELTSGKSISEVKNSIKDDGMEFEIQAFMEEFSQPANFVGIGKGFNKFGLPNTFINYSRNYDFDKRANSWLEIMNKIMIEIGASKIIKSGVRGQRGDHAAASCRMGTKPENSVVDKNLRIHGFENLFVCSNAVFPSGAAVNPTLTNTALAIRLANFL